MLKSSQVRELRLLESEEISPMKITSHLLNSKVITSPNCTVFEVCEDEFEDKENQNFIFLNDSSFLNLSSKIKKNNSNELSNNSSLSNKMVYAGPRYASNFNLKKENKVPPKKVLPQKENINKDMKNRPKVGPAANIANKPPIRSSDTLESLKVETDAAYCQYIQSLYINYISSKTLKQQESLLTNEYDSHNQKLLNLQSKINILDSVIDKLTLTKSLKDVMDDKAREIESLLVALSRSQLEEFADQLQLCAHMVEIDDDLELGDVSGASLSSVGEFAGREIVGDNNADLADIFRSLGDMLGQLNTIVVDQATQANIFKKKFADYVQSLLKNLPN